MGRVRSELRKPALVSAVLVLVLVAVSAASCSGADREAGQVPGSPPVASWSAGGGSQGTTGEYSVQGKDASAGASDDYVVAEAPSSDGSAPSAPSKNLVVQTKNMLVRVEDVPETLDALRALLATYGGSVESLIVADDTSGPVYSQNPSSDGRPLAGFVTVRVPVAKYESFVAQAAKLGKVLRHSENASDVTRQHVDLTARLKNLRAEEDRLRELFERAGRISDMLEVERELSRVRGEAESMQAQIETLENQAALATITLELVEPEPIVSPAGIDWGVADALTEGLRQFVATLNGIIVAVMGAAPVLVLIGLVALGVRAVLRRRNRRRTMPPAPAEETGD